MSSSIFCGVGLGLGARTSTATNAVVITGLAGGVAQPERPIGAMMSFGGAILAFSWGSSPGGDEFGTDPSPLAFASADGGTLYLTVITDEGSFSASAPVRHAAPSLQGSVPPQTLVIGQPMDPLDLTTFAQGAGLSFAVQGAGLPEGLTLAGSILSGTPTQTQTNTQVTIEVSNSGGREVLAFAITVASDGSRPEVALAPFSASDPRLVLLTDHPQAGDWHWARFPAGTESIMANGAGGWDTAPQESGTLAVGPNGLPVVFPETGQTGTTYTLAVYQRVNDIDSQVLSLQYTAENTAPEVLVAAVINETQIALTFSKTIIFASEAAPWTVRINGAPVAVRFADHAPGTSQLVLTLAAGVFSPGDTVALDYEGSLGAIAALSGETMPSLPSLEVFNPLGSAKIQFIAGAASGETGAAFNETLVLDMSSHVPVNQVLIMIGALVNGPPPGNLVAAELNGVAAHTIYSEASNSDTGVMITYAIFPPGIYPDTAGLLLSFDQGTWDAGAAAFDVTSTAEIAILTSQPETNRAGSDVSGVVAAGEGVIAAQQVANGSAPVWSGLPEDYTSDIRSHEWFTAAHMQDVPQGGMQTITISGATAKTAALSLVIRPV